MQRHPPCLVELALGDIEAFALNIEVPQRQRQGLTDPHSCDCKQAEKFGGFKQIPKKKQGRISRKDPFFNKLRNASTNWVLNETLGSLLSAGFDA